MLKTQKRCSTRTIYGLHHRFLSEHTKVDTSKDRRTHVLVVWVLMGMEEQDDTRLKLSAASGGEIIPDECD